MGRIKVFSLLTALALLTATSGFAITTQIKTVKNVSELVKAIRSARPGDVITLAPLANMRSKKNKNF